MSSQHLVFSHLKCPVTSPPLHQCSVVCLYHQYSVISSAQSPHLLNISVQWSVSIISIQSSQVPSHLTSSTSVFSGLTLSSVFSHLKCPVTSPPLHQCSVVWLYHQYSVISSAQSPHLLYKITGDIIIQFPQQFCRHLSSWFANRVRKQKETEKHGT